MVHRIEEFPTEELEADRAVSLADLALCQRALNEGVETYFAGRKRVQHRLEQNERIIRIMDAELERRSKET